MYVLSRVCFKYGATGVKQKELSEDCLGPVKNVKVTSFPFLHWLDLLWASLWKSHMAN